MPLNRIEAAIARLEAAMHRSGGLATTDATDVEAANARLREALGGALLHIDTLIARHGAAPQQ